jgi:hypothetical protein
MLGFLILFLLSKKPMNGQEIADEIANRKGERPSPGTVYPALKNLRLMGFIGIEEREGLLNCLVPFCNELIYCESIYQFGQNDLVLMCGHSLLRLAEKIILPSSVLARSLQNFRLGLTLLYQNIVVTTVD